MQRREFLRAAAVGAAAASVGELLCAAPIDGEPAAKSAEAPAAELARKMPRWRGFNLLEKFQADYDRPGVITDADWKEILKRCEIPQNAPFLESDFQWISDWGFDFVRLPMDYRCWTNLASPHKYHQEVLADIDRVMEHAERHGIHVCLNLHRAPGYTVAKPPETMNLWKDEEAQQQFDAQWAMFAERYRGIPAARLSFNPVNEPSNIPAQDYVKVMRRVTDAIRREDPDRLIIADGLVWGRSPVVDLADLGIAQSTRGYEPTGVTHYQASWVGGSDRWPLPTWPLKQGDKTLDRQTLADRIAPWKKLAASGVGVHVGEWGAFNKTPHDVVLAWARDCLELWREAGWGWALWNLRGVFGVVDSGRVDAAYEDFHGHKLDRKLLALLQAS